MRYLLIVSLISLGLLAPVTAQEEETGVIATAYQTVNVRGGPGAQFEIVGQLRAGESVPVDARDTETGLWLRVTLTDGQTGWVASFSVALTGELDVLPTPDAGETTPEPDDVRVTAYGRINVRSGPDILYAVIGQLAVGDVAVASARSNRGNDWLYIEYDDLAGWVAYFTVTVTGDPDTLPVRVPDPAGDGLIPLTELVRARFNVRLRAAPQVSAAVITVVPFNDAVTPVQRSPDDRWIYVMFEDEAGWALARLFDISTAVVAALPVADDLAPEATAEASGD